MAQAKSCLDPKIMLNTWQRHAAAEHVAQLTCELAMLKDTHAVPVKRACIVYVQRYRERGIGRKNQPAKLKTRHRTCFLPASWVASGYRTQGWPFLIKKFSVYERAKATRQPRSVVPPPSKKKQAAGSSSSKKRKASLAPATAAKKRKQAKTRVAKK